MIVWWKVGGVVVFFIEYVEIIIFDFVVEGFDFFLIDFFINVLFCVVFVCIIDRWKLWNDVGVDFGDFWCKVLGNCNGFFKDVCCWLLCVWWL